MTDRKTPLAAAIFATLYPATQGMAQQQPAPKHDPTRLEPVTVTATRRSENLQDVAQSVTALSTEFLKKNALTNLSDVVGALPSANVISSTPGRNSIVIRGISTGSAEYRIDSQVSVYLDEQPMTAISQQVDVRLIDIERVETLPGPQGTLFGSSSQAGTIRYVTNKPDISGFLGELAVEVGSTKGGEPSYDGSGWVNIPVTDNFALRAVGYWSQEGGYVDNVLGPTLFGDSENVEVVEKDQNDYRTVGGRIAGLWTINEKWDLSVGYIQQRGDASGAWETDPALGDNKITRFFDEYRDDEWYQASMTLRGDLGFAELAVTGSYFNRKINYEWDNTNYAQWRSLLFVPDTVAYPIAYYPQMYLYDTGYNRESTFNWQKQNRWTYEARLTSQGESRLKWMAGAFYEDVYDWWEYGAKDNNLLATNAWIAANAISCDYIADPAVSACPLAPTQYYYYNKYRNEVKQTAFFGEMSYDLTDKWSVTGGARWFEYKRDLFDQFQVPFGVPAYGDPDANALTSKSTDSDTTFKFATEYHVTPDVMLYALYSEGFRLGGRNSERAAESGQVQLIYGPDTLQNYEVGIKSEWFDHRLQLNASVFYMEWDDIQLHYDTDAWWKEGTINGGKAEQKGIELSGQWYATERLAFDWSVFLASPEFTEDVVIPNSGGFVYLEKGMTLPVSPKEKYWAAVEYTFPQIASLNGEFWTRFNYTYQGKTWDRLTDIRNQDPEGVIPEWKSGTLQFGFTSASNWDAALIFENVFDDTSYNYLDNTMYGDDFGDARWHKVRSLQRPFNVSLSFSKRW